MYALNYKFFLNNVLRVLFLRKYCSNNGLTLVKLNRMLISLELKDKEEISSVDNFLALSILTYITKVKSCLLSYNTRYKFGQKHTLVFQVILREKQINQFICFFYLNNLLLLKKKQIDLIMAYNSLHSNLLLNIKDLSFFSQLPAEYFKWYTGIKIELSVLNNLNINFDLNDAFCFLKNIPSNRLCKNERLKKEIFYYELFNNKR